MSAEPIVLPPAQTSPPHPPTGKDASEGKDKEKGKEKSNGIVGEVVRRPFSDGKWVSALEASPGKFRVHHGDRVGFWLNGDRRHASAFTVTSVSSGMQLGYIALRPGENMLFHLNMKTKHELVFMDLAQCPNEETDSPATTSVFHVRREIGKMIVTDRIKRATAQPISQAGARPQANRAPPPARSAAAAAAAAPTAASGVSQSLSGNTTTSISASSAPSSGESSRCILPLANAAAAAAAAPAAAGGIIVDGQKSDQVFYECAFERDYQHKGQETVIELVPAPTP